MKRGLQFDHQFEKAELIPHVPNRNWQSILMMLRTAWMDAGWDLLSTEGEVNFTLAKPSKKLRGVIIMKYNANGNNKSALKKGACWESVSKSLWLRNSHLAIPLQTDIQSKWLFQLLYAHRWALSPRRLMSQTCPTATSLWVLVLRFFSFYPLNSYLIRREHSPSPGDNNTHGLTKAKERTPFNYQVK